MHAQLETVLDALSNLLHYILNIIIRGFSALLKRASLADQIKYASKSVHAVCEGDVLRSSAPPTTSPPVESLAAPGEVERLRREEFSRMQGKVYADYAGAPPFSEASMRAATEELLHGFQGNPHSERGWGEGGSSGPTERLRQLTLDMCRADPSDYVCVLTSGATAALKLVADAFPWAAGSTFLYLTDNHNSVLGIREVAAQRGATTAAVTAADLHLDAADACEAEGCDGTAAQAVCGEAEHLFAFPAESNFSGVRYSGELVRAVQQRQVTLPCTNGHAGTEDGSSSGSRSRSRSRLPGGQWRVLIDAAKACSARPPDLSAHPADFVVLSYYKIFGHPSGLGALVVRREALHLFKQRAYFGGGAVAVAVAEERFHQKRPGSAGLEDGTLPFLSIPAALHGFGFLQRLGGWPAVEAHASAVASHLAAALRELKHFNASPACEVYGSYSCSDREAGAWVSGQGAVVTFNLVHSDGSWIGYRQVERMAGIEGIHLRTGCMCNPGACAEALGLTAEHLKANFESGHVCWDDADVLHGRPTGAVRASFGYASALADAEAISAFVGRYFVEAGPPAAAELAATAATGGQADESGSRAVHQGRGEHGGGVGPNGLLFDRHWALVDAEGRALSLKRCPALATIRPVIDLGAGVLRVSCTANRQQPLLLPLPVQHAEQACISAAEGRSTLEVRVCTRTERARPSEAAASSWFSSALGVPCRLVQHSAAAALPRSGFVNEAQLLLVSATSLAALHAQAGAQSTPEAYAARFRPNVIVASALQPHPQLPSSAVGGGSICSAAGQTRPVHADQLSPYCEESWKGVQVGGARFTSAGPCPRCEIICVDPATGRRDGHEPLRSLARHRRWRGCACFGILLNRTQHREHGAPPQPEPLQIAAGMPLTYFLPD